MLELSTNGLSAGPTVRKQVRINGVPKRGIDLVGHLRVVLFLPEDVGLVAGAPSERRRYLDIALCQIAPSYCRALSEYNRVVTQRNALLRRLRDEGGDPGQLTFWDTHLTEHGSTLIHRRSLAVQALDRIAAERHLELHRRRRAAAPRLSAQPRSGHAGSRLIPAGGRRPASSAWPKVDRPITP